MDEKNVLQVHSTSLTYQVQTPNRVRMTSLVEFTQLNWEGHRAEYKVMPSERIYILDPCGAPIVDILISWEH